MKVISELEVLKQVVSFLDAIQVNYLLSGSVALNFYVTPRMTRDIDIVLEVKEEDSTKLERIFKAEYYVDQEMIREAIRSGLPFNIIHIPSVTKIDLIPRKETAYQGQVFDRRLRFDLFGQKISVISPEDLILAKLDWAKESLSELQMKDVRSLLSLSKLDIAYLNKWAQELSLNQMLKQAVLK